MMIRRTGKQVSQPSPETPALDTAISVGILRLSIQDLHGARLDAGGEQFPSRRFGVGMGLIHRDQLVRRSAGFLGVHACHP
jgi:hypothetical protein